MQPTPKSTGSSPTKGKSVGVWLSGEALDALQAMSEENPYFRPATYCAEATVQRLAREGRLATGVDSECAAQAFELSQTIGPEVVKAALVELAKQHVPAVQLPLKGVSNS